MTKKKGVIALISGGVLASLGAIGTVLAASATCVPCALPALGYILAALGVVGISFDVLTGNTIFFSLIGVALLGVGIYFIRKPKVCAPKITSKKSKKKSKK